MSKNATEKLAAKPDERLRDIIAGVQEQALRTQSEAYRLVASSEHPDIDPADVIEIRCAPDPAIRVTAAGELPTPTVWCGGFIAEQDGKLYRCAPTPGRRGEGLADDDALAEAAGDPSVSIERAAPGQAYDWEVVRWSWQEIDPSFAERTVTSKPDAQVRAFVGVVRDDKTVKVHPDMAFGVRGASRQN